MRRIDVPRLLITGLHQGVGKTTITLALLHELKRRGVQVSAAITAPHLQVAAVYERITGRAVTCLDPSLLTPQQLMSGLDRAATGAEIVIIDGYRGLLDSTDPRTTAGSDGELAAFTHTPILFVVDAERFGYTLAAAVRGIQQSHRSIEWAGVALNRLPTGFEGRGDLVAAFETYKAPPPLISFPILDPLPPVLPNWVSQGENVTLLDRQFLSAAADSLTMGSDLEQIVARASAAPALECDLEDEIVASKVRLGVARDSCFSLFFHDNLEILRRAGADICEFSPLSDNALPEGLHGIYFPGGYLGEYGAELALNDGMRATLGAFLACDGVLYAEGSSLAYLANRFRGVAIEGEFPGLGLFPAVAQPCASADQVARRAEGAMLEYGLLGEAGDLIKGVYRPDWHFEREPTVSKILRVEPHGSKALLEGYAPRPNVFGTFGMWHFGSSPNAALSLVDAMAKKII